jgi:hypothetical protein
VDEGGGHNFAQLKAAILKLSRATDWETARKEWQLSNVYDSDEPDTCLCGHYPIIEICEIENRVTGNRTDVGNVCIKRFLGFRSDLIFQALKRIRKEMTKSLNADAITFFRQRGAITDWEYGFLQDTLRKRNLSDRQLAARVNINRKVLAALQRRGFRGPEDS